jgi:hypothetical protein
MNASHAAVAIASGQLVFDIDPERVAACQQV